MRKVKRTRKWHKAIDIRELRHLIEMNSNSLDGVRRNREHRIRMSAQFPGSNCFRCFECDRIEWKLVEAGHLEPWVES